MPEDNSNTEDANLLADKAIAILIAVISVSGILGNVSAFIYFWPKKHKGIPNKLYIAIVAVDIITSLFAFPVMISLFNDRKPMLFAVSWLCSGWTIVATFSGRMSMFLVAVLSVTRTIAIIRPLKKIKLSSIIISITAYSALLLVVDVTLCALDWARPSYYPIRRSYCSYTSTDKMPHHVTKFHMGVFQMEVLLPIIVVSISFVASFVSLMKNRKNAVASSEKASRKASKTIMIFTAVFLLCNVPIFILQLFHMIEKFKPSLAAKILSTKTIQMYGHLVFLYTLCVLNATLNPLVYLIRMSQYKEQFRRWKQIFV